MHSRKMVKVELVECPYGHGGEALVIGGNRIAGAKCCGSWETKKSFVVSATNIIEALSNAEELDDA